MTERLPVPPTDRIRVLLVTGMSGAGKSTALKALEGDTGELGEQAIMKLADALDSYIPEPKRALDGAFLMPVASVPFVRNGCYSPRAALGLTLAGLPAVFIAAKGVKSLELGTVKWLVAVVVIYTAVTLLRAAARERSAPPAGA